MQVHLVRHGQSEVLAGLSRVTDCGLTDLGREQSAAAAAALAESGVDFVLSSPYRRCLETAEAIRSATAAAAEIWPAMREHHPNPFAPGPWPLPTRSDLALRWPNFVIPADMPETRWTTVPEDPPVHWERINGAVGYLLERFAGSPTARVVVVTHEASAGLFVQAFCRLGDPLDVHMHIDPASITTLQIEPTGRRHLVCLNRRPKGDG